MDKDDNARWPEESGAGRSHDTARDIRKSERDLKPHTGMRPDRFPESSMTKDQRKDVEKMKRPDGEKEEPTIQELADNLDNTVGRRKTGSSPTDTAGVADLDQGLRRSRRK